MYGKCLQFLFPLQKTDNSNWPTLTDYYLFPKIVANTQAFRLIFGSSQVLLNKSVNVSFLQRTVRNLVRCLTTDNIRFLAASRSLSNSPKNLSTQEYASYDPMSAVLIMLSNTARESYRDLWIEEYSTVCKTPLQASSSKNLPFTPSNKLELALREEWPAPKLTDIYLRTARMFEFSTG